MDNVPDPIPENEWELTEEEQSLDVVELVSLLKQEHAACVQTMRRTLRHAMRCGAILVQIKYDSSISFGEYIKRQCPDISSRTASRYIRMYERRHIWTRRAKELGIAPESLTVRKAEELTKPIPWEPQPIPELKPKSEPKPPEQPKYEELSATVADEMSDSDSSADKGPNYANKQWWAEWERKRERELKEAREVAEENRERIERLWPIATQIEDGLFRLVHEHFRHKMKADYDERTADAAVGDFVEETFNLWVAFKYRDDEVLRDMLDSNSALREVLERDPTFNPRPKDDRS